MANLSKLAGDSTIPRKRRRDDAEMDITPMIDITFLLLIFFLVASKIQTESPIALPPAKLGKNIAAKNAVIISVGNVGGTVHVFKGDGISESTRVKSEDDDDAAIEIADYVRNGLLTEGRDGVVVKAAGDVKARDVKKVLSAIGRVKNDVEELSHLHIAVLQSQ